MALKEPHRHTSRGSEAGGNKGKGGGWWVGDGGVDGGASIAFNTPKEEQGVTLATLYF